MNIQRIVIPILIILLIYKYKGESFWFSNQVSTADGDKCIIKDGVMVCEEKGILPSWFYPSYYYPSRYPYYDLPYYYYYPHYYPRRRHRRRRWGKHKH
jgi:hypothetical protein